ncbi:lymphocyte cytosolic protein 2a isoform X2 [Lepisosteus oculatus]|uniref:lymphocyte cytosolic protein 2a isoform X2 n=1 Tax=Lepisosteus oculatus TaxID=7918 RepID=UPI0035F5094B
MSFDQLPSRTEVLGWNANKLAEYLKSMDLKDCDRVVKKHSINGPRFLDMSENDLQKFPKLHAPMISRLCHDINKKEEKRGLFHKKQAPLRIKEQEFPQDNDQGWDSEEFEDSDDYESPDAEDDVGSGGDYESPTEGGPEGGESDNDYEPPPSEPPDDQPNKIFPAKPINNNSVYIDNQSRGTSMKTLPSQPPAPPQRPGPTLPGFNNRTMGPPPPRREESPQAPFRPPNKPPSGHAAPSVDRSKKPTTLERGLPGLPGIPGASKESPIQARKQDRTITPPRRPPAAEKPPDTQRQAKPPLPVERNGPSGPSLSRRPMAPRPTGLDQREDTLDDTPILRPPLPQPGGGAASNSNTFPMQRGPRMPRPPVSDGPENCLAQQNKMSMGNPTLLSCRLNPTGSLPSRLQTAVNIHRSHSRGTADIRPPLPPPQPQRPPVTSEPAMDDEQDLDPQWYVAQITRQEAEACLRRVNQDGTYLVRDSSKRSPSQPYVLMVLYQNKVFNIQIRYHREADVFLLGTGLKGKENFTSVSEIIQHHQQTPLLLIDGKDRGSGHQRQCLLTYPAGY